MTSQEPMMTVGAARDYLQIGRAKMAKIIKLGMLSTQPDVLDSRVKLVKRADVEALLASTLRGKREAA